MAYEAFALLPLRIITGILFIAHGLPKLRNFSGTVAWLRTEGFWLPGFWAIMLSVAETFGGLALLFGFSTKIVSALLSLVMIVALYKHIFVWKQGFQKGYELSLLALAVLIAFIILGSGNYALDNYFS